MELAIELDTADRAARGAYGDDGDRLAADVALRGDTEALRVHDVESVFGDTTRQTMRGARSERIGTRRRGVVGLLHDGAHTARRFDHEVVNTDHTISLTVDH